MSNGSGKSSASKVTISYQPYIPPAIEAHDYKNMRIKRPMSPHLTIYAPNLTAATSIFQRITGKFVI